jgi:hypothetical protein
VHALSRLEVKEVIIHNGIFSHAKVQAHMRMILSSHCLAFPFPAGLPLGFFSCGAFTPSRALISSNARLNTFSKPSFRLDSNITSLVLMVDRPACFAKVSRSREVFAVSASAFYNLLELNDISPICVYTSSVRAAMNWGVALRFCCRHSSST